MAQKIIVNDNLTNIFNFITSTKEKISYMELIQYCIDYDLYKEFYLNNQIINRLYEEKMKELDLLKGGNYEEKTNNHI